MIRAAFSTLLLLVAAAAPQEPKTSVGLTPLTELAGTYKGETGGLYGGGRNQPPPALQDRAGKAAAAVVPLDPEGKPVAGGKVVLLSIGMSNTTQEFSVFKKMADADPQKSRCLVVVDGAQGGRDSTAWVTESVNQERVWRVADERIAAAGAALPQVQVVWIKQALIRQGQHGEFPAHARKLEADLARILELAAKRYPNLRLAYLSSRIYAGYATTPLNPEPYAYEGAFSVRWLIERQMHGESKSPVALWGPYLWADGTKPRKDGLTWERDDLSPADGTHPSPAGREKVARLLLDFFKREPTARSWFLEVPGR
jgi:hypothetical protein